MALPGGFAPGSQGFIHGNHALRNIVYYYYFVFQVISAGRQHIGNVDVLLYQMKKSLLQIAEVLAS